MSYKQNLFHIDPKKGSLLHIIAKSSACNKLDLLVWNIYHHGIPQSTRDGHNRKFMYYLKPWERKRLNLLCAALNLGKVRINEYAPSFTGYLPHGYSSTHMGVPVMFTIWEHDLGEEKLIQAIKAGYNLDHPMITKSNPPLRYKKILAQYGCPFNNLDGVQEETDMFYPPLLWSAKDKRAVLSAYPVEKCEQQLFRRSIVCIADTHWEHRSLSLPAGDILVCAGDLQMPWTRDPTDFVVWLGSQPHRWKILIAGNHDKLILANKERYTTLCKQNGIIYLEDSGVIIEGIKFWGSPWTPIRPKNRNNAFTLDRIELMQKWNQIPADVNVLITHSPPYGIGDLNSQYYKGVPYKGGDFGLLKTINRLRDLKLHIFGHQHYGRGVYKSDSGVYFANSAVAMEREAFIF